MALFGHFEVRRLVKTWEHNEIAVRKRARQTSSVDDVRRLLERAQTFQISSNRRECNVRAK